MGNRKVADPHFIIMEIEKEELKQMIKKIIYSDTRTKAQWIYDRIYNKLCYKIDNYGEK